MSIEEEAIKRFNLNPDESVLIERYPCMYSDEKPIAGKLYLFNDYIGFTSGKALFWESSQNPGTSDKPLFWELSLLGLLFPGKECPK